jgi:hypothetical protein
MRKGLARRKTLMSLVVMFKEREVDKVEPNERKTMPLQWVY